MVLLHNTGLSWYLLLKYSTTATLVYFFRESKLKANFRSQKSEEDICEELFSDINY